MDIVIRTHPPHKSYCSQRLQNTFAKIGAKIHFFSHINAKKRKNIVNDIETCFKRINATILLYIKAMRIEL